jgi:hypothetical protein
VPRAVGKDRMTLPNSSSSQAPAIHVDTPGKVVTIAGGGKIRNPFQRDGRSNLRVIRTYKMAGSVPGRLNRAEKVFAKEWARGDSGMIGRDVHIGKVQPRPDLSHGRLSGR